MKNHITYSIDIPHSTSKLQLRVYFPYFWKEEFFIDSINGRKWGYVSRPILLADVINANGKIRYTIEQKEFAEHIDKEFYEKNIKPALHCLKFKADYYLRNEYPSKDLSFMKKIHLSQLPNLFDSAFEIDYSKI